MNKKHLYTPLLALTLTVTPACGQTVPAFTLAQLTDSALQNNARMSKARQDIEAAGEQRKEAYTHYFPNVSGTGFWFTTNHGMAKMDINPGEMIDPALGQALAQSFPPEALAALANPTSMTMMKNGVMAGVSAVQPVFAGGQIVNGNKLARLGEEVSQLQLQLTEDEVEKNAAQYFWQIVSLQEKMRTLQSVEALLADIHKDVSVALKAGVILRNDLLQVELRQNDIESQKLKLQNGLSLVRMLLAQYCGLRDTTFTLTYDPALNTPALVRQDHEQALRGTATYQLLNKQVEAADLQRKMAIGEQMPSVAVGAGYNFHNMLERDHSFAMVFATVSVPLSGWWGGSHAIKRKKIAQQQAVEQLTDNSELLKIGMQKAWNDVQEAYLQTDLARKGVEQAKENLRLNRDYYRAGTATMSTLLEAQLLYQQTLDKQTDAYCDYQNKVLAYRQAVGM